MNVSDELQKLQQLHQSGALSDEEFAQAKAKVLAQPSGSAYGAAAPDSMTVPDEMELERQTEQWAMLLHFSLLAGFVLPGLGLIAPLVIWQWKKQELPGID